MGKEKTETGDLVLQKIKTIELDAQRLQNEKEQTVAVMRQAQSKISGIQNEQIRLFGGFQVLRDQYEESSGQKYISKVFGDDRGDKKKQEEKRETTR